MITRKSVCAHIAAQIVAAAFGTAFAQTGIEEIVVTARKRAESLQEVPLAVTAFTSQDLARRAVTDMKDIARLTPGFRQRSVDAPVASQRCAMGIVGALTWT